MNNKNIEKQKKTNNQWSGKKVPPFQFAAAPVAQVEGLHKLHELNR